MSQDHGFFREATLRICGSLEIEKSLYTTFMYLKGHLPADAISLYVYEPGLGIMRTVVRATSWGGSFPEESLFLPIEARKKLSGGSELPHLWNLPDMHANEIGEPVAQAQELPLSSALVMILRLEGQELGAAVVNAAGRGRYTPEHAKLFAQLNEPFAIALANGLRYQELARMKELLADDNRFLKTQLRSRARKEVIGAEFGLKRVMEMVYEVAPLPSPVLLLGETGTGKEVIAGVIHDLSPRREGPFIKVNCGALPPSLLDSELFGHEKGAFTGAIRLRRGLFERAQGGTIFLDEVGELPAEAQVRLLRVLQEREIERVGGTGPIKTDIRLIAATHRDLDILSADGNFRSDLYFRLRVFPVTIPPLRERKADIPVLVQHFIQKKMRELGFLTVPVLAPGALERLLEYTWPGNVRELENAVERALIIHRDGYLHFDDIGQTAALTPKQTENPPAWPLKDMTLEGMMREHIGKVMTMVGGRVEGVGGAAEHLALNPSTLRNKMRKLGIPFGRETAAGGG
jgi:transcriptional regulator with GAF, ATPase, and Fis domain